VFGINWNNSPQLNGLLDGYLMAAKDGEALGQRPSAIISRAYNTDFLVNASMHR